MYVISYDLSNDRLRNKVAKELENYGKRVQYSVFECDINAKKKEILYQKLSKLMENTSEGNIRFYTICGKCKGEIQTIGLEPQILSREEEEIFII